MELLKRYKEELKKEFVIDDFNIKEVQLRLPARKHFWAARLIDAKIELNSLKKQKKRLQDELAKRIIAESPVKMFHNEAVAAVESLDEVIKLTDSIKEYEFIIEYLEKVEKIFSNMHWEIRNIIQIKELEQL